MRRPMNGPMTRIRGLIALLLISTFLTGVVACGDDTKSAPPGAQGATALCQDGTLSYSQHHQGTCSGHGGVATWYR
jgi:uncharacterized protein DUF3761